MDDERTARDVIAEFLDRCGGDQSYRVADVLVGQLDSAGYAIWPKHEDWKTVDQLEEERDRLRDQLTKAEALRDEWEGTFRIWRQRCAEARAERDRLREIAHAGELLVAALDAGTVHNEWSVLREKLMSLGTSEGSADG